MRTCRVLLAFCILTVFTAAEAHESAQLVGTWSIVKYASTESYERQVRRCAEGEDYLGGECHTLQVVGQNLLLQTGAQQILGRLAGATKLGSTDIAAYEAGASYIVAGQGSIPAAITTQTRLEHSLGAGQVVDTGYPTLLDSLDSDSFGDTLRYQATVPADTFTGTWAELVLCQTADQQRCLNRIVSSMGTKAKTAVWVVQLDIRIS